MSVINQVAKSIRNKHWSKNFLIKGNVNRFNLKHDTPALIIGIDNKEYYEIKFDNTQLHEKEEKLQQLTRFVKNSDSAEEKIVTRKKRRRKLDTRQSHRLSDETIEKVVVDLNTPSKEKKKKKSNQTKMTDALKSEESKTFKKSDFLQKLTSEEDETELKKMEKEYQAKKKTIMNRRNDYIEIFNQNDVVIFSKQKLQLLNDEQIFDFHSKTFEKIIKSSFRFMFIKRKQNKNSASSIVHQKQNTFLNLLIIAVTFLKSVAAASTSFLTKKMNKNLFTSIQLHAKFQKSIVKASNSKQKSLSNNSLKILRKSLNKIMTSVQNSQDIFEELQKMKNDLRVVTKVQSEKLQNAEIFVLEFEKIVRDIEES